MLLKMPKSKINTYGPNVVNFRSLGKLPDSNFFPDSISWNFSFDIKKHRKSKEVKSTINDCF